MQVVQIIFFYGIMAAILLMLYKVSKQLDDFKRSLADIEERIVLAMLPKQANRDNTDRL
jgi:hypothetical protein